MILRWTFSPLGREQVEAMRPDLTLEQIAVSQRRIAEWKVLELRGAFSAPASLPDLRPLILRLQRGVDVLDAAELHTFVPLLDHLGQLHRMRRDAEHASQTLPALWDLLEEIDDFAPLARRLGRSVSGQGEVLDTASAELGRIRRDLLAAQQSASEMLEEMLGRLSHHREDAFVTLREGRFVLSVRSQQRSEMPGLLHGRSQSGQSLLIEPYQAVEANNRVSEAREDEKREVARILRELTALLAASADGLAASLRAAAVLELIRAQARLALDLRAEAPALNEQGRLRIAQGRHPILAAAEGQGGARVVPLDLHLESDRPVLVVSGPNMGGKSVALKTVGLLVLMARAGLHVPAADGTDLPFVDAVFVDLGDEQSIEGDLSTFAGHLRNIDLLWREATGHSLVLLDELGGGTDPEEGAALAMAVLEELSERGTTTVATTHLTAVKLFAGEQAGMQNAAMEFDPATLSPRFRLRVGETGWSRAFDIARRITGGSSLLEKAEKHRSSAQRQVDQLVQQLDAEHRSLAESRRELEDERARLRAAQAAHQKQAERLKERLQKIRSDREMALGKLYQETQEYLRGLRESLEQKARESAQSILPSLRGAEREVAQRAARNRERRVPVSRGRRLDPASIRAGLRAWLPDFGGAVRIERVSEGRVWVEWQGRRIEVPLASLEELPETAEKNQSLARPFVVGDASAEPVPRELDLRGRRAEEALEMLDRFLDRASLAQLRQVRIVHGKGTGALMKQVRQHLTGHPLVRSQRMGELSEGGWGVTVAELGGD